MIIGNGLIARTLTEIDREDVVFFASGVSNSQETNLQAFQRESSLLSKQDQSKTLVYFSTCSINDVTLVESAYIKHKIAIEEFIKNEFSDYYILRLPTLVGNTNNPNTFFNFIKNKVLKGQIVNVHQGAWRYLLDADDLKVIVPDFLEDRSFKNSTIHVAYNNAMPVLDIVKSMDKILNVSSRLNLIDQGSRFDFDHSSFMIYLKARKINLFGKGYNESLIKKYLAK